MNCVSAAFHFVYETFLLSMQSVMANKWLWQAKVVQK